MGAGARLSYWRRIARAYLLGGNSNLSFWHETPEAEPRASFDRLGPYYMGFAGKADYGGPFDERGVPLLDYKGSIGRRYNPIAIAQYGLAHYNRFSLEEDARSRAVYLKQADWLAENLEPNAAGLRVWMHHFDFEYRETLKAPWYSGLAQGQGLSLLARARALTGESRYDDAMRAAYASFGKDIAEGGVACRDRSGDSWLEEYIVDPPSHILNGFIWALWGILDYRLATGDKSAAALFDSCVDTLERVLPRYDTGFWSLYDLAQTTLSNPASPFYHRLHIVQLDILHRMTRRPAFQDYARRWRDYAGRRLNRLRSYSQKCAFKVLYY